MHLLFFSISGGEIFFVLIAVLIIFGPKRIPEMARKVGRVVRDVRRATDTLKTEIMKNSDEVKEVVRKPYEEISSELDKVKVEVKDEEPATEERTNLTDKQ